MDITRILRHWFTPPWHVHRHFSPAMMAGIGAAITESERSHLGEVRFAVEGALPWRDALDGISARERALEVFSRLRIWDTEHNSGVLIYLLLADRDVEIVADRGVHGLVGAAGWEAICREMEAKFHCGAFDDGVLLGIARITAVLQQHYPVHHRANPDELPDAPVIV